MPSVSPSPIQPRSPQPHNCYGPFKTSADYDHEIRCYDRPEYQALLARGISCAALEHFRVEAIMRYGRAYWRYPVRDENSEIVAWRLKACDGLQPHKYSWEAGSPSGARYLYNVDGVTPERALFLCAGEPDAMLLHSIGFPAVSLLGGESSSVSEIALDQLQGLRPAKIAVIYDHDQTGRDGAIKVVRRLRGAGMKAIALALPDYMPEGADVSDLYADSQYDVERFCSALNALRCIDIPLELPQPLRPLDSRHLARYERYKEDNPLEEVVEEFGVILRGNGRYRHGRCPFHHDKNPSFWIDTELGIYGCFACAERGNVITFLRRMGEEVAA